MENPQAEIPQIIHLLTQSPPSTQRKTLETYFTPSASFTHPFCRTGSFEGSRWLIWCIYRWYKIMSPRIEISVDSVAYDPQNLILYVSIHQIFRIWPVPFYAAPVSLVTVLRLVPRNHHTSSSSSTTPTSTSTTTKTTYLIASQNDLYQVNEFIKFVSQFGILSVLLYAWQVLATGFCVLGSGIFWWVSWVEQNVVGGNEERSLVDVVKG